jgi:hypothetical protein
VKVGAEGWTEVRALVQTPASILASPPERRRGYVQRWTSPGPSPAAVRRDDYDLRRSEETLAVVVAWERRTVIADLWESYDPNKER